MSHDGEPLKCRACLRPRWNDESVTWLEPKRGRDVVPYCTGPCADNQQSVLRVVYAILGPLKGK